MTKHFLTLVRKDTGMTAQIEIEVPDKSKGKPLSRAVRFFELIQSDNEFAPRNLRDVYAALQNGWTLRKSTFKSGSLSVKK